MGLFMIASDHKKMLSSIWHRHKDPISTVTSQDIKKLAEEKLLKVESVEEVEFGFNTTIKAICLKTTIGTALYPKYKPDEIDNYNKNIEPNKTYEKFFENIDWFLPPYIAMGKIHESMDYAGLSVTSPDSQYPQEKFDRALPLLYGNLSHMGTSNNCLFARLRR